MKANHAIAIVVILAVFLVEIISCRSSGSSDKPMSSPLPATSQPNVPASASAIKVEQNSPRIPAPEEHRQSILAANTFNQSTDSVIGLHVGMDYSEFDQAVRANGYPAPRCYAVTNSLKDGVLQPLPPEDQGTHCSICGGSTCRLQANLDSSGVLTHFVWIFPGDVRKKYTDEFTKMFGKPAHARAGNADALDWGGTANWLLRVSALMDSTFISVTDCGSEKEKDGDWCKVTGS